MTSRDEALKLARMHVSGEAYGRLVAGDAYVLARTLIAEARRAREYRDALAKCRSVLAGEDMTKQALIDALAAAYALLGREDERG